MDKKLSSHILPTAGTMVGVCMTVISIVKLEQATNGIPSLIDDVLAFDALIFLASAILSYFSIRKPEKANYLEDLADGFFVVALLTMGVVVLLLTYELI